MNIQKIAAILLGTIIVGSLQSKPPFQPPKHMDLPLIFAKKKSPVHIKPEAVTPEEITKKNQTIIKIENRLKQHFDDHPKLSIVEKAETEVKNQIKNLNQKIVNEQKKNEPIFVAYQKAKKQKNVTKELQNQVNAILRNVNKQQQQLGQYLRKLQKIQHELDTNYPERTRLLKKLKESKENLQEMKLIKLSKPETPKK